MRAAVIILVCLSVPVLNVSAQDVWEVRCPEDMVYVPAGQFVMGSTEHNEEKPVRRVYVDAFYIDQYPVTNAQFKEFVDATEHRTLAEDIGKAEIPRPRIRSASVQAGSSPPKS